jgi:hypothetical protein
MDDLELFRGEIGKIEDCEDFGSSPQWDAEVHPEYKEILVGGVQDSTSWKEAVIFGQPILISLPEIKPVAEMG